ncbi:MAG: thioesterase family protein [Anaerolineae bacterium]|nr:thioesterase family protein [Anaerolineae bacterium]MDQ7035220.1 thioesterase family protein [Anaerolineae bacterium]
MEKGIRVGLIGEAITTVTSDLTAITMGSGSVSVYATPAMIALMEAAAISALDPHLPESDTSVGIEIHVQHLSATPVGEQITAMAEITHIDGKRVKFELRAWDEREIIGQGTHTRFIIDADEFTERLTGKKDKEY